MLQKGFVCSKGFSNEQRWPKNSDFNFPLVSYCFEVTLFDLQCSLLFCSVCCISVASVVCAFSDWLRSLHCPSAIGSNGLHVHCDWSTVGKTARRTVVVSPPAVQSVHMLEVNKTGVYIISVLPLIKTLWGLDTFLSFYLIKFVIFFFL